MFISAGKCLIVTHLTSLLIPATATATLVGATSRFGMEHPYLRGVRIEMKDGRKLVGYVAWSSEATSYDKEPKFPQSLIDPKTYPEETKTLELYIKLYPVSKEVLGRDKSRGRNADSNLSYRAGSNQ